MSAIKYWEVHQYAKLINEILYKGEKRASRVGNTYSVFGKTLTIDCSDGFPLLRGRKMFYKPVLGELAAMLRGPKHVDDFKKFGCNYWDDWAAKPGDCLYDGEEAKGGELNVDYGNAWLDFNGFNQLEDLVYKLKNNPDDRRMIISAWRPDRLHELSLPCCHMMYQWYVREKEYLDMIWYQRSVDTMIGLPSDIILGAVWNIILARQCGYKPGLVQFMLGDTHIYENHISGTLEYMRQLRDIGESQGLPYSIAENVTVDNFKPDMINVKNYNPRPAIKFELNV